MHKLRSPGLNQTHLVPPKAPSQTRAEQGWRKNSCGSSWHSWSRNVCGQPTQPFPKGIWKQTQQWVHPQLSPAVCEAQTGPQWPPGSFTMSCPGSHHHCTTWADLSKGQHWPASQDILSEPRLSLFPGWQGNGAATRDWNVSLVTILDSQSFSIFENLTVFHASMPMPGTKQAET